MSEHHMKAGEMDEAEDVFDVVFPSSDESAEIVHPGEQPFHFPSPAITAQLASIPSLLSATAPVGRDHFDVVLCGELLVERVRVIGLVADEPGRELIEEASGKNVFHKLALGRRSAFDIFGERKTVINGDSDDLRAFATAGGANGEPPYWRLRRSHPRTLLPDSACLAHAAARPAVSVLLPTSLFAPTAGSGASPAARATAPSAQYPQHTVPHRPSVMPRAAKIIGSPSPAQHRLDDQPLFIGQLPASCHAAFAASHRAITE